MIQSKYTKDPAYYIGKGKAEELAEIVEDKKIDLVIFDDDLSPVQVRNLEKLLERKIVDRSGLILDIFAFRAKTKEAKTVFVFPADFKGTVTAINADGTLLGGAKSSDEEKELWNTSF